MDGKQTRPETRSQTANKLTEAELEIMQKRVLDQQERMNVEMKALRVERKRFEKERELVNEAINKRKEILQQKETESQRWLDIATTRDETQTLQELEVLRQEIKIIRESVFSELTTSTPFNKTEHGSVSTNKPFSPKITFQETLETVPIYDGNNMSISQFIRACRRAKDVVPASSERNLTHLLINKLRGRALAAVEDEPCDNVTELIDLLNNAFETQKTIDQYKGELNIIYLKPNEHILDYISRVKDLRSSIMDAGRREYRNNERYENEIDNLTVRSFCEGLPLEYRLQLQPEHYMKAFKAFAVAKFISKQLELDKVRYGRANKNQTLSHTRFNN
jgi:hypothetical protein